MKYEYRLYYDSYNTGNYTEDKKERFSLEVTDEKAKKFIELWTSINCTHYETSKAHFYEKKLDSRHYSQYILYK